MNSVLFQVVVLWLVALVAALALAAFRARTVVERALALEVLTMVLVAALAAVALHTGRAGYLDVALVLALLGFTQTLATARLAERRLDVDG